LVFNRIFAEEKHIVKKQTATYFIPSPLIIRYCGQQKGDDSILFSKKGKKDKTELRLTLRSVCKAEDTAFRSLKDSIKLSRSLEVFSFLFLT